MLQAVFNLHLEKQFMSEMVMHRQGAIDMAKLEQTQSTNGKLRKIASDIVAAQIKEITDMQPSARQWNYQL